MSLLLNIETGTQVCSVALSRDDGLISLRESDQGRDHARNLALYIDEILKECGYRPSDIDAVAVSMGPGSYTGLRIGVSTAKGLSYALDRPLVAVGSLLSLAHVAAEDYRAGILDVPGWENSVLCPMIDARRMEVYAQLFDTALNPLGEVSARIVEENTFDGSVASPGKLIIFGDGAAKCEGILPHDTTRLVEVSPSARGMVIPAFEAYTLKRFEDVAYFEPYYLKDFVVTASKKKLF